ncbi:MAG: NAD(P)-binding protein [Candidatus Latescibacterota bacterium]|nr:NAD(P)-binding protein [Candidatus Latescibacterota bacterium]
MVGGDAAGMSAASQMRRADPKLEVLVLERGDYVSCGMPYYIAGEIATVDALLVLRPEEFKARGIEVRAGARYGRGRDGGGRIVCRGLRLSGAGYRRQGFGARLVRG